MIYNKHVMFILRLLVVACQVCPLRLAYAESYRENFTKHPKFTVSNNSSITMILLNLGLSPIYGREGYLNRTREINIARIDQNPDFVLAGEKISLPVALDSQNACYKIENGGFVLFETPDCLAWRESLLPKRAKLNRQLAEVRETVEPVAAAEVAVAAPLNVAAATPAVTTVPAPTTAATTTPIAVTPASPPPPTQKPKDTDDTSSEFRAAATAGFHAMKGHDAANNSNATLLSDLDTGAALSWRQNWGADFATDFEWSTQSVQFAELASTDVATDRKQNVNRFDLAADWQLSQKWSVGLVGGAGDQPVYRAITANEFEIDTLPETSLAARVGFRRQKKSLEFSAEFEYGAVSMTGQGVYKSASGTYWQSSVGVALRRRSGWGYFTELRFRQDEVSFGNFDVINQELETRLGFIFILKDEE